MVTVVSVLVDSEEETKTTGVIVVVEVAVDVTVMEEVVALVEVIVVVRVTVFISVVIVAVHSVCVTVSEQDV